MGGITADQAGIRDMDVHVVVTFVIAMQTERKMMIVHRINRRKILITNETLTIIRVYTANNSPLNTNENSKHTQTQIM